MMKNSKKSLLSFALFACVLACAASATAAFNGPLRVSDNGRYFVAHDGKPFLWLGDSAWPLLSQYTLQEAEDYITNRKQAGYTLLHSSLVWGLSVMTDPPTARPNVDGEPPWFDGDVLKPNEAYFEHVDRVLEMADQQNLVVVMSSVSGYLVVDTQTINMSNARAYGRWLGKRFGKHKNLVFSNGGDRVPLYREDVYRAVSLGIREGDGGAHLITYHPSGWRSSSEFFHSEDWLDYNTIQTWTDWAQIHNSVVTDGLMTPAKPTVVGEAAYEDGPEYPRGPITPLIVRRQAWWALTGGGFFSNGHNEAWRMEDGWQRAVLDAPAAPQVGHISSILEDVKWWNMVPDQGLLQSGASSEQTLNTAMRTRNGDQAIVYLASQCHVFINLEKFQGRRVKARWINPATGEERDAGSYLTGNDNGMVWPDRTVIHFETPGMWEDALLRFDLVPDPDPAKDGLRLPNKP